MPAIDLCVLGPLTATVDGHPVPLGGPRQMAVLARLVLAPDQVVPMSRLVDSVWDGDEPARPDVAIRSYVSNLRRVIEPNRRRRASDSCLASSPPGYRLAIPPECVDWVRYERLVNRARDQLTIGQFGQAISQLRHASGLWRGEPCAGLPDSEVFRSHRVKLTTLRETAVELLFESLLLQGDHLQVAAEVEAAIAENPLRERLTELGMVALYRCGRQSDALALGQQLRVKLRDQLGIDPSPSIDAMELKILNHDRSLDPNGGRVVPHLEIVQPGSGLDQRQPDGSHPRGHGGRFAPAPAPITAEHPAVVVEPTVIPAPPVDPGLRPGGSGFERRPVAGARGAGPAADLTGADGDGFPVVHPAPAHSVQGSVARPEPAPAALAPGSGAGWSDERRPTSDAVPTLGREAELAALASIGDALDAGRSATAIVTGEQGIGKTMVVRSTAAAMHERGFRVAWSRPLPAASGPLWPWTQLVLALLDRPDRAGRAEPAAPGPDLPSNGQLEPLAALGPAVQDALGLAEADGSGQPAVTLAVTGLLEHLARRQPLVLVFEDLQWADEASIALLTYAANVLADVPVAIVGTWRDTDVGSGPVATRLRELLRAPALIRVELDGLPEPAVRRFAAAVGRPLSATEVHAARRRAGGNPLFLREILAHRDLTGDAGCRWSTLIDAVDDRLDRLGQTTRSVLELAALFRRPFTAAALDQLAELDPPQVHGALAAAVGAALLEEVDGAVATYRFRHPVVAEVLRSEQLAVERADRHRKIGQHLSATGARSQESAYHLARSPVPEDRLDGAAVALDLFWRASDVELIGDVDDAVAIGLATLDDHPSVKPVPWRASFLVKAEVYRSWRAWLDGCPGDWLERGVAALDEAFAQLTDGQGGRSVTSRSKSATRSNDPDGSPAQLVSAALANLIGRPAFGTGPVMTGEFVPLPDRVVATMADAAERLPQDDPIRWSTLVHLAALAGKSVRDGQKIVTSSRRRLSQPGQAAVLGVLVSGYEDLLDAGTRLKAVDDVRTLDPGLGSRLLEARHGYLALLDTGRTLEAELLVEETCQAAVQKGTPLQAAEARLLLVRHLLWVGQLGPAEELLITALDRWATLGLAEPVAFARQRRAIAALAGIADDDAEGFDGTSSLLTDRARPAELALRLARAGDLRRAAEALDTALEAAAGSRISLCDQALIAEAAAVIGHERAASQVLESLVRVGDRPIARSDGSIVLGPASFFAAVAASVTSDQVDVDRRFDEARGAVERLGGCPAVVDAVRFGVAWSPRSNRLPTHS